MVEERPCRADLQAAAGKVVEHEGRQPVASISSRATANTCSRPACFGCTNSSQYTPSTSVAYDSSRAATSETPSIGAPGANR